MYVKRAAELADAGGLKNHRLNACGYSLGAAYTPTWMDWPILTINER
ncbi:MAG: hypothetical protein GY820_27240 [Gammaproteobacteria bacterium]|nr:hypothetical protein [Gammaproteobacteria bacterium]